MPEMLQEPQKGSQGSFVSDNERIPDIPTPSHLKNRYQFVREIGHGAQGKVYLAIRLSDDQRVVIKQLKIGSVKNWKEYTLFKREGEVLSGLDIDGVAKFYEAPEFLEDEEPCAYIVQEYISGESLKTKLDKGFRLKVDEVYDITIQILNILEALHHHEPPIIHRDIKPSNIMLEAKPGGYKVYLIDFGAVSNPQIQGGGSTVAGTFGYMPPEQLMGNPEPASDIYALGAMIVYMLGGVSPENLPIKDFHLIFEPELQHIPDSVVKTLRQMLDPDSQKRLSDCSKLQSAFQNYKNCQYYFDADGLALTGGVIDNNQYNKELRAVSNYGESGNIGLWAKLPEATPRAIPDAYQGKISNFGQLDTRIKARSGVREHFYNLIHGDLAAVKELMFDFMMFFVFYLIALIITLLSLIPLIGQWFVWSIFGMKKHIRNKQFIKLILPCFMLVAITLMEINAFTEVFGAFRGELYLISVAVYAMLIYFGFAPSQRLRRRISERIQKYINERFGNRVDDSIRTKDDLIKHGRKSIAKIVNIRYVPAEHALTDLEVDNDIEGNIDNISWDYMFRSIEQKKSSLYLGVPTFKIFYVFNPPDDRRSEDLMHVFYTHIDPSEHYEIGDLLPILYRIENRGRPNETVVSMPFPFVLDDPVALSEIIWRSH